MAISSRSPTKKIEDAKAEFVRLYLDRSRGIYSVGIGRSDGEFCLRVSGNERAIKRVPDEFRGVRVLSRLGAPGIVGLARL